MEVIGPDTGISENALNRNGPGSDVQTFINFLSDPLTQIPLQSNFLVAIDNIPSALLNPFPANFENKWNIDKTRDALVASIQNVSQTPLGGQILLFAQGFTAPGESIGVERQPSVVGGPSGGLLSGVVSQARTQYGNLDLAILETNSSFVDFVIRPWIALVGHYGLVTRVESSVQNVKTGITGVLFDKNNNNEIRKVFKFRGCAPVNCNQYDHIYGDIRSRIDRVSFTYNTFSIDYQL